MISIHFFQEAGLICLLFFASLWDLKARRIPNRLLLLGGAALLLLRAAEGVSPAVLSLCLTVLVLLVSLPLYRLGMAGAADFKMIALIIGCRPDGKILFRLGISLCLAAGFSLIRLFRKGLWRRRLTHFVWYAHQVQSGEFPRYYLAKRDGTEAAFPMAVFLFLGVLAVAVAF